VDNVLSVCTASGADCQAVSIMECPRMCVDGACVECSEYSDCENPGREVCEDGYCKTADGWAEITLSPLVLEIEPIKLFFRGGAVFDSEESKVVIQMESINREKYTFELGIDTIYRSSEINAAGLLMFNGTTDPDSRGSFLDFFVEDLEITSLSYEYPTEEFRGNIPIAEGDMRPGGEISGAISVATCPTYPKCFELKGRFYTKIHL
jgi:hypothetical protein